jgi:hypothetical protein
MPVVVSATSSLTAHLSEVVALVDSAVLAVPPVSRVLARSATPAVESVSNSS